VSGVSAYPLACPSPRTQTRPGRSGLTPSQAEDIDFETRLASYSNDELKDISTNSLKVTKGGRSRSKDDVWVDILVASHSWRCAGNLDAALRRPAGGPRSPNGSRHGSEMASLEITQVLASVRGPSHLLDVESVDVEPMNVPRRSKIDSLGSLTLCSRNNVPLRSQEV